MNLISRHPSPSRRANHANLKRWTHELLRLDDDATLTINEVRCPEPGCPDLETVIGISCAPGRWRRLRVPRPVADVTREDLRIAAQDVLKELP